MLLLAALGSAPAAAAVVDLQVTQRVSLLDGQAFGEAGAYEKIAGIVTIAVDPDDEANGRITDLGLAPRDSDGRVRARANFMVLKPVDPKRSNGVGLLEVSNRGGKASLRYFNGATVSAADPVKPDAFGDGLLMRLGLTVIWVGWQFDVSDQPGNLRLEAPVARGADAPLTGLARSDWVVDAPVPALALGHRGHRPYPVYDRADPRNVLYRRAGRDEPRREVPRERWRFGRTMDVGWSDDDGWISLDGGFKPGHVYELVYVARDPVVVGLGLAMIRDLMAYARFDPKAVFPVRHAIAFGVSQTGRFLRQFLYQGFNVDEQGRRVFDGMLIHTAGAGRGSFNHRFAQPSRDAHRYSAFFYPTDLYPFASLPTPDPVTGRDDGLLDALDPAHRPKVMVTNTGYEYWGRAASLIHTAVDGQDLEAAVQERIYHLASGQHYVGAWPSPQVPALADGRAWRSNPLDFLVNLRALLSRLVDWVARDQAPPHSRYPQRARGELVTPDAFRFVDLPGLTAPDRAHVAYRADYGPDWSRGVIGKQPPWLGPPFVTQVPAVDTMGNELGGVRNVEITVPLATYTPWSLRGGLHQPAELNDFVGMIAPLAVDDASAVANGDPRPSVASLYRDRDDYLRQVAAAAAALVEQGFLLDEDQQRVLTRASKTWAWVHGEGRQTR